MKKLYIEPAFEVFGFETEKMIAQSVSDPEKDDMDWTDDEEEAASNKLKHDWDSKSPWK